MSEAVSLAICGFGRAGNMHLTSIRSNPRCRLKYVVDREEMVESTRASLAKMNMSHVTVVPVDQFETQVLADGELAAVLVVTPTDQHETYVIRSLSAGKAVFCEKPIAANLPAIKNCYDVAERMQRPLFCAFNRRFDPAFHSVWKQVKDGQLGKIHFLNSISRDSPIPSLAYLRISNGLYHDSAVHDIDMICWIIGEEPAHVYAQGHAHSQDIGEIGDVDTIAIVLTFLSGVLATIHVSRHSTYGYDQRLEVLGEKGTLSVANPHSVPIVSSLSNGITQSPYQYSFPERYRAAYYNELDHFLDCVLDPSLAVKVTVRDTLLVGRVADACERSARSNKAEPLEPSP